MFQGELLVSSSANREELAPALGSSANREDLDCWTEFPIKEFSGEDPNNDMMGNVESLSLMGRWLYCRLASDKAELLSISGVGQQ